MADEAYYIPDDAERRFRETVMGVVTGQVEERMSLAWKIFHPVLTHFPMEWRNCTPDLLASGVDCASTPRRPGERGVSHQHLIVTRKARVLAPSSSDAPNQTATEPVMANLVALIEQELELAHSGEGYEPKAVAEEIVKDHVAPALAKLKAANDKRYADRRLLLWLHAKAVWERDEAQAAIRDIDAHATPVGLLHEDDPEGSPHHYLVTVGALHRALGKSNGTGVKCDLERDLLLWLHAKAVWERDVAHQMLERMETQHVTWTVAGEEIHPDWCRECRVDRLRAELAALKAEPEPKKRAETTCASGPTAENPTTTPPGVTPAPTTSPREPWRTTTGAATALATQSPIHPTEQGAEVTGQDGPELQCDALGEGACRYLEGHDGGCKPKFGGGEQPCEHGILRGMMVCPVCDPEKHAEAEESARAHAARSQVGWTDPTPATPTEPRAVYHDPGNVQHEYDEDDNPINPSVGWDIAWGCRVSFSHYDGAWRVTVSISDAERRNGGSIRTVTREQLRKLAHQLIELTEAVETTPSGIPDSISTSSDTSASRTPRESTT